MANVQRPASKNLNEFEIRAVLALRVAQALLGDEGSQDALERAALLVMDCPDENLKRLLDMVPKRVEAPRREGKLPVQDQAAKVARALEGKPKLRFHLLRQLHMDGNAEMAGPWERGSGGAWKRCHPDGRVLVEVRLKPDGQWWWLIHTGHDPRGSLKASLEEAAKKADEELLAEGWKLVHAEPPTP
jgi:hypothetical protein